MRSPAPRGRKKNLPKFRLRRGTSRETLDGVAARAPLRNGAPPRPPCSSCTLLHTATRPPITQPAQETVLGSAVPSLATLPAPCFQGIHSGLRQVRFLRKLMPGEGFYMHVLCYLLKSFKRYAVHTAIASCCHGSSCALIASRLSLTWYGAVLSSCIPCRCWHFASQPSGTQGRLESRKIENGL